MGVFGAMLMPSTLSLLRSIFTDRDQRRLAIAVWAAGFSAGAALGPIVGGILLEHFAWGSVFLLAVPVLVPLLILVPILVPESRDPNPGRFDPISVVLSLATMVPIVYAIKEFAVHGLSRAADRAPRWWASGSACCSSAVNCGSRRRCSTWRSSDAGVQRRGARQPARASSALVGFLYFVAQHLQLIVGLSPMEAGLALVPGLAAMIVVGAARGPDRQAGRRARIVVPVALMFSVLGYVLVALSASASGS